MLTERDLSFFRVGRLSSTSISSTMLSSWVFCLFSLDVFAGSFSSISVSAKYLEYYYFNNFYLINLINSNSQEWARNYIYQCPHPPRDEGSFSCDLCLFCSISLHICIFASMPFSLWIFFVLLYLLVMNIRDSYLVRLSVMILYETNRSFYTW